MANFKYYENDYELAVLELLENCGWEYECGYDIHREKDDVILGADFQEYLNRKYHEDLLPEGVGEVYFRAASAALL